MIIGNKFHSHHRSVSTDIGYDEFAVDRSLAQVGLIVNELSHDVGSSSKSRDSADRTVRADRCLS